MRKLLFGLSAIALAAAPASAALHEGAKAPDFTTTGAVAGKPVGTVCFSLKLADGSTTTRTNQLAGDRSDIRNRSTTIALHMLRRALGASC